MKTDDVTVKPSTIHGKGVFANRNFKKGEVILHWNKSRILSKEDVQKLTVEEKQYINLMEGVYVVMQDPEKYVNHSCLPNTTTEQFCDIAIRDIVAGEEITSHYNGSDPFNLKFECNCGCKHQSHMTKRAFLIHGWDGYPEEGWRPWLKQKLEEQGFIVTVPAMPNTAYPERTAWIEHLKSVVEQVDEQCYFVGHSLGCITILRYLEQLQPGEKVGGVVLVAGFASNLGYEQLESFFPDTGRVDWEKVKSHCNKFVAIHSDNDAYVSTHYGEEIFAPKLGAEYILEHDKKHFSGGDGVNELPSAFTAVMKISQ